MRMRERRDRERESEREIERETLRENEEHEDNEGVVGELTLPWLVSLEEESVLPRAPDTWRRQAPLDQYHRGRRGSRGRRSRGRRSRGSRSRGRKSKRREEGNEVH